LIKEEFRDKPLIDKIKAKTKRDCNANVTEVYAFVGIHRDVNSSEMILGFARHIYWLRLMINAWGQPATTAIKVLLDETR